MNTYQQLWQSLTPIYEAREAQAVVRTLLEERFHLSFTDIVCGKVNELSADKRTELEKMMRRLQKSEPIQYITGRTEFAGRVFHVAPGVLIPRPETAELCRWITHEHLREGLCVLDLCTGSGCIACTLALDLPSAKVSAWDISDEALQIAAANVKALGADVTLALHDALHLPYETAHWDIIVSNPPYICEHEKAGMEANVLDYEPSLALFVPDEDPLRFYRAIAHYAITALNPGGWLYFEINPLYEKELKATMDALGYEDIETREDAYGKKRMTRGRRGSYERKEDDN